MGLRWVSMLVIAGACGRVGFDPTADPTSDGGPVDSTTDANPASRCGGSSSLRVCDGFEAAVLDARYLYDNEQGTATRTTQRAFRGSASLFVQTDQITTPTVFPRASVQTYDGLPLVGTIDLRVFIYLTAPASPNFVQLINFSNDAGLGMSMGVRNGKVVNNDYTAGNFVESTTVFPTDRWVCVEYKVPSNTTDALRVYLDDVEVADAALTKASAQPQPTHVYVGIDWPNMYSSLPPSSAWFDEMIIDDVTTTCAQ